MAQTLDRPPEETEEPTEPRRRRLPLLAAAAAAVVVALAAGVWLWGPGGEAGDGEEAPPEEGAVVEVTDLTANIGGEGFRYARVSMAAVLAAGVDVGPVERRFPILKDAALSELATMPADELRTAEGLDDLRGRLSAHADEIYPNGEVLRILITELVVQ